MDALICDFAQYYHIYDIDRLQPHYAAVLACGLPEESRTMKIQSGSRVSMDTLLLASMVDELNMIAWILGRAQDTPLPPSVFSLITGREVSSNGENQAYTSPEEFSSAWENITQG